MKHLLKRLERKFFNVLKFDIPGYYYTPPSMKSVDDVRNTLLDDYFQSQPGLIRGVVARVYLFLKKGVLFILRRAIGKRR